MTIDVSCVHLRNAEFLISVVPAAIVKSLFGLFVGSLLSVAIFLHALKAFSSRFTTLSGMVMSVKPPQHSKALLRIVVTLSGMVMAVRFRRLLNANFSIILVPSAMSICVF